MYVCDLSGKIHGKVFLEVPGKAWAVDLDSNKENCESVRVLMNNLFRHPVNERNKEMQSGLKYLVRYSFSCHK